MSAAMNRLIASYSSAVTWRLSGATSLSFGLSGAWLCVEYKTIALPNSISTFCHRSMSAKSASSVTRDRHATCPALRRPFLTTPPTKPPTSFISAFSSRVIRWYFAKVSRVLVVVASLATSSVHCMFWFFHLVSLRLLPIARVICPSCFKALASCAILFVCFIGCTSKDLF